MDMFTQHLHLPVTCVDRTEAMLGRLKGLADPEAKRKAIGAEFIEVGVYIVYVGEYIVYSIWDMGRDSGPGSA